MNKKNSVIAHVDEATQGVLNEVTDEIASAISDELGQLTAPMQEIHSAAEDIRVKLQGFDALATSLDSLRALVTDSRKFGDEILPLQTEITALRTAVGAETKKLSQSLKANADSFTALKEHLLAQAETLSVAISNALHQQKSGMSVYQQELQKQHEAAMQILAQLERSQSGTRAALGTALVEQKGQLSSLEERLDRQDAQIAALAQTGEKILLTLELVVNLVTPFWKKIGI